MEREQLSWRDLLGQIINDTKERQRIARVARVRPITLWRWARGISKPTEESLCRLLRALPPDSSQDLLTILQKDFPALFLSVASDSQIPQEIPSAFYDRVLNARTLTPPSLYTQTLSDLILRQTIEHLDPEHRGMAVSLVRCMAPFRDGKIHSLREVCGVGTPPWSADLGRQTVFLGAESLCGRAVMRCHLVVIHNRQDPCGLYPAHWVIHEQSAVACPLLHQARIVGCLLVSCAHPYQLTEVHLAVVQRYANLLTLAFSPTEFFDLRDMELCLMPPYTAQAPYLEHFGQRVTRKLTQTVATARSITLREAHEQVWQEIEADLLENQTEI